MSSSPLKAFHHLQNTSINSFKSITHRYCFCSTNRKIYILIGKPNKVFLPSSILFLHTVIYRLKVPQGRDWLIQDLIQHRFVLLTLTYLLYNCMPWVIAAVGIATEFLNSSQIIQIMLCCHFTQNMLVLFYATFSRTLLILNMLLCHDRYSLQISVEQATSVQKLCRTVRLLSVCSFFTVCSHLSSVYNDVRHNSLTLACPLLACFAVFNMP